MPTRHYPFQYGENKRLTISWKFNFKEIKIELDGEIIGSFSSKKSFPETFEYTTKTGEQLQILLRQNWILLINNEPIPGAPNDPAYRVRHAFLSLYSYGLLHMFVGSIIYGLARLEEIALLGNLSILIGIAFLLLGILVQRGNVMGILIASVALLSHFLFLVLPWEKPEVLVGGKGLAAALLDVALITVLVRAYPHLKNYNILRAIKR
jgi:hypothetical protein